MGYQIEWAESAAKEFSKHDNSVKIPIRKFLDKLTERDDPRPLGEEITALLRRYETMFSKF
jgi:mRNA-degrading endonuclease RelE of RelBE toxin-antitoxin system